MSTTITRVRNLFLLFSCIVIGGCNVLPQPQTEAVRHFTLAGPTTVAGVSDGTVVQPVQVAGHLRNRSMAIRVGENEVIYLEDVVWAESLADGITQTLRDRLSPISSAAVVSVQVQRCEVDRSSGNSVQLVATYAITTGGTSYPTEKRGLFKATPRTWDGKSYTALVTLLREAVGELADRLVSQLPEKK